MPSAKNNSKDGVNVKYPVRRARILLSGVGLLTMVYFFGSVLFLIPSLFFVSAYGSWGWLLTLLLLSGVVSFVSYRGYQRIMQTVLEDAEQITPEATPELTEIYEFVQRESESRGIEPPTLYLHPDTGPNAMAVGRRQDGHIVIFEGLLTALDDTEQLKAVVGHEIAHVHNRDSVMMTLIAGMRDTIVRFWTWFGFALRKGMYERRGAVLTPTEESALLQKARKRSRYVCSPIGLFQKSISRHREYIADAEGAKSTAPDAMIGALKSIEEVDYEFEDPDIAQSLCIHGTNNGLLSRIRSTHPPMEKRIRQIRDRYPETEP